MCTGVGKVEERKDITKVMADEVGLQKNGFVMAHIWDKAERKPRNKDNKHEQAADLRGHDHTVEQWVADGGLGVI